MILRESQFERAAELFYEAAAVPELWSDALQFMAEASGALGVVMYPMVPGPDRALCGPGMKGVIDAFLSSGWLKYNPYMQRGMELTAAGRRGLITSYEMMSPEETAQNAYVNEFADKIGIGRVRAGVVLGRFGTELSIPIVFERAPGIDPYRASEIAALNRLTALLRPAADMAVRVGFASARSLADSLSQEGKEIGLLAASGRLIHSSPGLERLFDDAISIRGGRPRSWHPAADERLTSAIKRVISHGSLTDRRSTMVSLPRRRSLRPLLAQVVPITGAGQDVFMLARAALILTDPDASNSADAAGETLVLMGLTPAEVRLARRIGAGEELRDIAEAEGLAIETIRARLKSVFSKTGTHRQVELALLVVRLTR